MVHATRPPMPGQRPGQAWHAQQPHNGVVSAGRAISQFRKMGYEMIDVICEYYSSLGSLPVKPSVTVRGACVQGVGEGSCRLCRLEAAKGTS